VKFACERCGRSYALADELRGKTFKMKCKACGHLIVVKGNAAEAPARVAGARGGAEPTPSPVTIPDAPLGDESPARGPAVPEVNPFVARPVSAADVENLAAGTQLGGTVAAGPPGPAAGEYIDLVLDEQKGEREPAEARGRVQPPPLPPRDRTGLEDPFADWKPLGEIDKDPLAEPVEPPQLHLTPEPTPVPGAAPGRPHPERPWAPLSQEGLNLRTLVVIGGVAVMAVAVLLFVYVGRGGEPPAPSAPVAAQPIPAAPAPGSPPAPAEPAPSTPPAAAEPLPAAEPVPPGPEAPRRRAEAGQRTPRAVKVASEGPRPESGPVPGPGPGSPPRPAPAEASAPAATPGADGARPKAAAPAATGAAGAQPKAAAQLTEQQVARVASANKRAFEQCIAEAGNRDPALDLGGRQVTLTLTVNPDGTVASSSIDDAGLDPTDLGSCIRSAARIMIFPAFGGDPMEVEVPLSLGR
jgi:DNA-directed RNA polymerase subunit RPC12/RpoP